MSANKLFQVDFTYAELTSSRRRIASSKVEAADPCAAKDIIIGRWFNVRIKRCVEVNPQDPLQHSV